eukprot:CAMPEP_0177562210 /NCGR_PEP_ID=MMETSP0369-20130122/72369_1 /TAXON_ID=447022 ORGANISM="Scrippsiella hangoei-like, Strain SHHI-4" /NCGR_SAMPLE_ID=MMETSP0369 /ASSEMBLY_ACC=CAM_ASM_000364 /LENGTH=49 /DNA_ID= /DNA_START= /DNA_END= /DNA_ORIENTATION=
MHPGRLVEEIGGYVMVLHHTMPRLQKQLLHAPLLFENACGQLLVLDHPQ